MSDLVAKLETFGIVPINVSVSCHNSKTRTNFTRSYRPEALTDETIAGLLTVGDNILVTINLRPAD